MVRDGEFRIDFAARSIKLIVGLEDFLTKMEIPNIKEKCKVSTKVTKSGKNFNFYTLQFFRQGRIPLRGTFCNVIFTKLPPAI
ncbi:MAG: hypothetical protein B6D56_05240 [Candidatus Omnitrophica bacterium 4484_70.1]|nr:MAG: hypothetical protein B6D56_05240 [Candidatus Omnitrophica bacterium 4484_70.1]